MALQPTKRRFTVAEYHQMAQADILSEDDRVELIDGEILEMAPIGRRHAGCVDCLAHLFYRSLGQAAQIRVQGPVRLSERSEPQPDIAVLRPRPDFYRSGHPTPEDVLLLVEVAETSAEGDRRVKVPLYARSGIREFWPVDLEEDVIFVYRDPTPTGYRTVRGAPRGERLAPLAFPTQEFAVADILG